MKTWRSRDREKAVVCYMKGGKKGKVSERRIAGTSAWGMTFACM